MYLNTPRICVHDMTIFIFTFMLLLLGPCRRLLVNAGGIPVLSGLLKTSDLELKYYCIAALANIAVDGILCLSLSLNVYRQIYIYIDNNFGSHQFHSSYAYHTL